MAKDLYGLTDSGIAPELQAEYRGLNRKQAIQEALLQQAMTPAGGVIDAGHFKVARSPLEGLGKVAQAYMARQGLNESDKKFAELGSRQAQITADEVRRYQQMKTGTPEVPATPAVTDVAQTNQSIDTFDPKPAVAGQAAVPADPRSAVQMAMLSRNPLLQKLGAIDTQQLNRVEDRADTQKFQAAQAQEAAKARSADIAMRLAEGRITKEEADKRNAELRLELAANQLQWQQEHRQRHRLSKKQLLFAQGLPLFVLLQSCINSRWNVSLSSLNRFVNKLVFTLLHQSQNFFASSFLDFVWCFWV